MLVAGGGPPARSCAEEEESVQKEVRIVIEAVMCTEIALLKTHSDKLRLRKTRNLHQLFVKAHHRGTGRRANIQR
jgi:hypothetical protein